jgi:CRISPR-associated protein Cmr6
MTHSPHNNLSNYEAVPMEYRAQINHRCSRQYPKKGHASKWVKEWLQASGSKPRCSDQPENPYFKTLRVQIDWRLVSNSGTDEGIIRPVLAAGGWPLIPGSSIKGLFRRACQRLHPDRLALWCGDTPGKGKDSEGSHGILRFHGAWPTDEKWKEGLLDIVHGQQRWQVWDPDSYQTSNGREWKKKISHNANAIISLYRPELIVPISTSAPDIEPGEWESIQNTLHAALAQGIGGRTCAGYGSIGAASSHVIFECGLEGQGIASTLLTRDQGEFRPNLFRASIRGMALRLFGGLCSGSAARKQTGHLFGSIDRLDGGLQRGLLESRFIDYTVAIQPWSSGQLLSHCFATQGRLQWHLTRDNFDKNKTDALANLVASLHALVFCLGGFGRGWRRADHFIFYPDYYRQNTDKPAIGCHWQWRDTKILIDHPDWAIDSAAILSKLVRDAHLHAINWLQSQGVACNGTGPDSIAPWREVIHPAHMAVWMRKAQSTEDSEAIHWFHRRPERNADGREDPRGLKLSSIAGYVQQGRDDRRVTEVSRIWHRMLPCANADSLAKWIEDPNSGPNMEEATIYPWPGPYCEVLTLFEDRHQMDSDPAHQAALKSILDAHDSPFERVAIPMPQP